MNKLDLMLMGEKNILARMQSLDRRTKALAVGSEPEGVSADGAIPDEPRPNIALNGGLEAYDRGATFPKNWTPGGAVAIQAGTNAITGVHTVQLTSGASLAQQAPLGVSVPQCAYVVSVFARCETGDGQQIDITLAHTPGVEASDIERYAEDGTAAEATNEVPADGAWYRFSRSFILTGGDTATVTTAQAGAAGTIEIDAIKIEKVESNNPTFIAATEYQGADWGVAHHIRDLHADNITTGTLVVGGSISTNPRISVKDGADVEIITIGDPAGGFYGIEIKQAGGLRISGSGSAEVTGSGVIRAGTAGAQRVDLAAGGLQSYDASGNLVSSISSADGSISIVAPTGAASWARSYSFSYSGDSLGGMQGYGSSTDSSVFVRCMPRTGCTSTVQVTGWSDTDQFSQAVLEAFAGADIPGGAYVMARGRYTDSDIGVTYQSNLQLVANTIQLNAADVVTVLNDISVFGTGTIQGAGESKTFLTINDTSASGDTLLHMTSPNIGSSSYFVYCDANTVPKFYVNGAGVMYVANNTTVVGGLNVGTASGAASGQVKASDRVISNGGISGSVFEAQNTNAAGLKTLLS